MFSFCDMVEQASPFLLSVLTAFSRTLTAATAAAAVTYPLRTLLIVTAFTPTPAVTTTWLRLVSPWSNINKK